ncbi:MAG: bifunctional folylpolyglutamate synthase/dihydrofolate synthase [Solirubrobacteraceae bacterium]|nr:bifunctional folylpolyglutamate synthase/dihydrofolate synthase [Solirubrobacteraceae bacterium]
MDARPAAIPSGADDAERWLLSLELFGMRFGLDRMRRLLTALGSPQDRYGAIHVVGTNGKSSTTRMIAALLERHGVRAGSYLSPHLVSFAERIRVGDTDIGDDAFAAAVARARTATERVDRTLEGDDRVTQFEALTAAALDELARQRVEVAVVEAGLGGRYDATNVLDAPVVVLTNVGLEHTRWLGPTVADIAREKLAVVPPGGTLVLGADLHPDARREADEVAARQGATIVSARADPGVPVHALGGFQRRNFAAAMEAVRAWLGRLDDEAVRAAAAQVAVPGRFQLVARSPDTILDGAHNPGGMEALAASLPEYLAGRRLTAVISVLDDKDAAAMLTALLPHCAHVVVTSNANPRALSPATLESLAAQIGTVPVQREPDPKRALVRAREVAGPDGVVLATGSIYLIADLLREAGDRRVSML